MRKLLKRVQCWRRGHNNPCYNAIDLPDEVHEIKYVGCANGRILVGNNVLAVRNWNGHDLLLLLYISKKRYTTITQVTTLYNTSHTLYNTLHNYTHFLQNFTTLYKTL